MSLSLRGKKLVTYAPFVAIIPQTISSLSQTFRMIHEHSSRDQSLVGYCSSVITLSLWTWYWTAFPGGKWGFWTTIFTMALAAVNVLTVIWFRT